MFVLLVYQELREQNRLLSLETGHLRSSIDVRSALGGSPGSAIPDDAAQAQAMAAAQAQAAARAQAVMFGGYGPSAGTPGMSPADPAQAAAVQAAAQAAAAQVAAQQQAVIMEQARQQQWAMEIQRYEQHAMAMGVSGIGTPTLGMPPTFSGSPAPVTAAGAGGKVPLLPTT